MIEITKNATIDNNKNNNLFCLILDFIDISLFPCIFIIMNYIRVCESKNERK